MNFTGYRISLVAKTYRTRATISQELNQWKPDLLITVVSECIRGPVSQGPIFGPNWPFYRGQCFFFQFQNWRINFFSSLRAATGKSQTGEKFSQTRENFPKLEKFPPNFCDLDDLAVQPVHIIFFLPA